MTRRSASGTDRRRRMLNERVLADGETSPHSLRADGGPASGYPPAALELQPRISSLMPGRLVTIGILFLLGALALAGVVVLHTRLAELARFVSPEHLVAFDLNSRSSLAAWMAAVLAATASAASFIIYSVRRHRHDDYQGRYRVWIWLGLACGLMSLIDVTRLHLAGMDAMVELTGWRGWGEGTLWWLAPAACCGVLLGGRMALEIAESRLALAGLLSVAVAWTAPLAIPMGWLPGDPPWVPSLLPSVAWLAGHLLLLLTLSLYGRQMLLEAEGRRTVVRARRRPEKEDSDGDEVRNEREQRSDKTATVSRHVRIDRSHTDEEEKREPKRKRKTRSAPTSQEWVDGSEGADDDYGHDDPPRGSDKRRLSKAERKRLRKLRAKQ